MTTLKEQYELRKKEREQKKLQEAKELLESHVLIFEKLDVNSINRIATAMASIESTLGPHLTKLPLLKTALDNAEKDLNTLASGRAGNDPKKVNALLGKALGLYRGLSEFFRDDLPKLVKLPMFKPAQEPNMKDQPLRASLPNNGAQALSVFQKALAVSKTGGFLQRLFQSSNLPYVDNNALAQQLLDLTYPDLLDLTKIATMPAVANQGDVDKAAAAAVGAQAPAGQQPGAGAPGATAGAPAAGGHPNAPEIRKALSAFVPPDKLDAALAAVSKAATA